MAYYDSDGSGGRFRWFKRLLLLGVLLVLIAAGLLFALTRGPVLRRIVLPRVSAALNARVEATVIKLGFSNLRIQGLSVQTEGAEQLLRAEQARVRFSLLAFLSGGLQAEEIVLVKPELTLSVEADGGSNFDPIRGKDAIRPLVRGGKTRKLDIGFLKVTDGRFRYLRRSADGARSVSEVSGIDLEIQGLRSADAGKANLKGVWMESRDSGVDGERPASRMRTGLDAEFEFELAPSLFPRRLTGDLRMRVTEASGAAEEFEGLIGTLSCEFQRATIRQLALVFNRGGETVASITAGGSLEPDRKQARLQYRVAGLDRNVLNFVGAPFDLDFGNTKLEASGLLDVSRRGNQIAADGQLNATQLGFVRGGMATPRIDLQVDYQFEVNRDEQTAIVRIFRLEGRENDNPLVDISLDSALHLSWSRERKGYTDSSVTLGLHRVDLGRWARLLGGEGYEGVVTAKGVVQVEEDGRDITATLQAGADDLVIALDALELRPELVHLRGSVSLSNFRSIMIDDVDLRVGDRGALRYSFLSGGVGGSLPQVVRPLLVLKADAGYDMMTSDFRVQGNLTTELPSVLALYPVDGLEARSGLVEVAGRFNRSRSLWRGNADVALDEFQGSYKGCAFDGYDFALGVDAERLAERLNFRRISLQARTGAASAGRIDANGIYNLGPRTATFKVVLGSLRETALEPLIGPVLAPRVLRSIEISGDANVDYDPAGSTTLMLTNRVSNLNLVNSAAAGPQPPLEFGVEIDAERTTERSQLRKVALTLPATGVAPNRLTLSGELDHTATNGLPNRFQLTAAALDVTGLYEFLKEMGESGDEESVAQATARADGGEPSHPLELRPVPLVIETKVDGVYLHELVLSNLTTTITLSNNVVSVPPTKTSLNGAPVTAALLTDLGRPGQPYAFQFEAHGVPVEPLHSSFDPENAGKVRGELEARVSLRGAGLRGSDLQRTLQGDAGLTLTNLELEVAGPITKYVLAPAALLLRNEELLSSPIRYFDGTATVADGRVDLTRLAAGSDLLDLQSRGTLDLAPVLSDSALRLPVDIVIDGRLAAPLKLKATAAEASGATRPGFVALPRFLTVAGTIGRPKTEVDKLAAAGLVAGSMAGLANENQAEALKTISGILQGMSDSDSPASTNEAGGANAPLKYDPADALNRLRRN